MGEVTAILLLLELHRKVKRLLLELHRWTVQVAISLGVLAGMPRSSKWLKSNNGTEAAFKSNKEEVLQEAIILATIAKVISHDDYGYADDTDYLGHSMPMLNSSLKIATAVKEDNFDNFDAGLNRVLQSCTECHTNYRNN